MSGPPPFQKLAVLAGTPAATFRAWVGAELAEGTIPHGCPHPATADHLLLPSWTLHCGGCYEQERALDPSPPGPCASCDAPGVSTWTWWLDEDSQVTVVARVCEPCGTAGTVPVSSN